MESDNLVLEDQMNMYFTRNHLLVFGLGVAATAAITYKFTRSLFGSENSSNTWPVTSREDSGCSLDDPLPSDKTSKPTVTNVTSHAIEESTSDDVINNNNNVTVIDNVISVGSQCDPSLPELTHAETQTDVISDSVTCENLVVALNLKLIHTNVFMLKRHFEDELAKHLVGDLEIGFYRSGQLGNYIFIHSTNKMDLETGVTFCAQRYLGQVVMKPLLPWKIFTEKTVSFFTVSGKKRRMILKRSAHHL